MTTFQSLDRFRTGVVALLTGLFQISGCSAPALQVPSVQAQETVTSSSLKSNSQQRISKVRSPDELFLFQPTKYPHGDWNPEGLDFEDVWLKSTDGTQIHCWYCPAEKPRAVMLYCHGNGGNLAGRAWILSFLQNELGVSTLIFDYRGYGRSEGNATVSGALADARTARTELARRADVKETEVVLLGRSLGGAVAVQLAADKSPRGLILESTFSSFREVAGEHFPRLAWLVPQSKLNSKAVITKVTCPILQCHGDVDRVVSFASGRRLFDAAPHPKQFITLNGLGHNEPPNGAYYQAMLSFLERLP